MRGFDSCYPCIYTYTNRNTYPFALRFSSAAAARYVIIAQALRTKNTFLNKKLFQSNLINRSSPKCSVGDRSIQAIPNRHVKHNYAKLKLFLKSNSARLILNLRVNKLYKSFNYEFDKKTNLGKANSVLHLNTNSFFKMKRVVNNLVWLGNLAILPSQVLVNSPIAHRFRFKPSASFNISDYTNRTLLEFLAFSSGSRSLIQFYPFLAQGNISAYRVSFYKTWISRLEFYQKRLGHRFFMEETIHIMHLAMTLHDSKFFSTWLGSLIKRISFWKTRAIFRYLLYLFNNFFNSELAAIDCKGLKLRLKGKISAAGNSRKRVVNLKFGKVSYSTLNIKCLRSDVIITTFTGAMNLRVEIFY